jgi:NAD(P)-dependent dehydrogenase (short-subunit alcohol dehydrogenase family)
VKGDHLPSGIAQAAPRRPKHLAFNGIEHCSFYYACKSAGIGFTRNLAHEVAEHGIYVLGVCRGMLHETLKEILRHRDD